MDKFTQGYIQCALWASTDDEGEPLDSGEHELSDEARTQMAAECKEFQEANRTLLDEARDDCHRPDDYLGHDFWLTRNGHGAGFWDRKELGETLGRALTDASKKAGGRSLYVSDAGKIEHTNE